MTPTIKAILARCDFDSWEAVKYCNEVINGTTNPYLKMEYKVLAMAFIAERKAMAAHV